MGLGKTVQISTYVTSLKFEGLIYKAMIVVPATLLDYDNVTRTKYWGYKSANECYSNVSCGEFLPYIDVPFMVL